ncbi:phosphate ABC transporter permease PstA [Microbulbifer guangxiensis]|uniref:phosphate ABC transporter permease PstA n=1 Tax=Microbulbifer guangxiensis TaxID=2904249 RepID=UPI001F01FCC0|nr:phosphate ABC transporter permease PstA [Microbulbifer guangxiensis]
MTDLTQAQVRERIEQRLGSRHRKEKLFRGLGIASIAFGVFAVLLLFTDIISKGSGAFVQTAVQLEITYDPAVLGIEEVNEESLTWANFTGVVREALRARFPDVSSRSEKRELNTLVSTGAPFTLRDRLQANPELLGKTETLWFAADDDVDTFVKSLDDSAEGFRGRTSDQMASWVQSLKESGQLEKRFNTTFFTNGDSREPEQAGIRAALVGSLLTLLVTLALSFPIGVAAAIYLEEYAPKNRWTDLIEVNINNLAAVPSIVFGLLGLAIFINFFELPRSAPLVGGLVLTLMTLPTIIISSRAALKSVPPSIREAAMGMGASRMQVVLHHVLPLAMPGMLTGAIIGMAQALGETAPLLMIGMVAFIVDVPGGITDPATVLPVQIFLWADSPERAFVERTSAAIMVLLSFLIVMNASAVLLRKKLERRW